jgi:hypothetical protein
VSKKGRVNQSGNKVAILLEAIMGVTVGKYHLFKRSRKSGDFYYYWFLEGNQQIIKSCGRACTEKRDAVAYLQDLLKEDLLEVKREEKRKVKREEKVKIIEKTLSQFAKDMFLEGATHLERWKAKGNTLKPKTIAQHRRHLVKYLLPKFGKLSLDKIHPAKVEDHLLNQRLSNSCRNTIIHTLQLVLREAKREGIIDSIPEFEPFKKSGRRQNVLSNEELTTLFPYDEKELGRVHTT